MIATLNWFVFQPLAFCTVGDRYYGPFSLRVMGSRRFVIVVTGYFSRWVEVKALVNIYDVDKKKFV